CCARVYLPAFPTRRSSDLVTLALLGERDDVEVVAVAAGDPALVEAREIRVAQGRPQVLAKLDELPGGPARGPGRRLEVDAAADDLLERFGVADQVEVGIFGDRLDRRVVVAAVDAVADGPE